MWCMISTFRPVSPDCLQERSLQYLLNLSTFQQKQPSSLNNADLFSLFLFRLRLIDASFLEPIFSEILNLLLLVFTHLHSGTILKYIASKYKVADNWYPGDLLTQARINEYIDWQHTGLRKAGVDIFVGLIFTPMGTGKPVDEEKLNTDYETLDKTLGVMQKKFLGDKQFLCADKISIADIMAISELTQVFSIQRCDVLANYPKLAAWKDRVIKELNPYYDEVNKVLFEFVASIMKK